MASDDYKDEVYRSSKIVTEEDKETMSTLKTTTFKLRSQYRYARSLTRRVARGICSSKELDDNETLLREYATGDLEEKLNKATRAHGFGLLRGDESGMLGVASFT